MDAVAIGENSQIIDYPNQNIAAASQNPNLVIRPWENALNNKDCYQPPRPLCRPQYNPPLEHNTSFSQLEKSYRLAKYKSRTTKTAPIEHITSITRKESVTEQLFFATVSSASGLLCSVSTTIHIFANKSAAEYI